MGFILILEITQRRSDRIGGGLAQAAQGTFLHRLTDILQKRHILQAAAAGRMLRSARTRHQGGEHMHEFDLDPEELLGIHLPQDSACVNARK